MLRVTFTNGRKSAMTIPDLWNPRGKTDRGLYALIGFLGFAIKHNLDRVVATYAFGRAWNLFNYWIPIRQAVRITALAPQDRKFLAAMLLISLPFVWIGLALTMRRLRDAGLPVWLVLLFFAPYANLVFFVVMCVYPSHRAEDAASSLRLGGNPLLMRIIPTSKWGSAALAAGVTSILGVAGTILSVKVLAAYGWGVFIALPFCMGFLSVLLYGYHRPRTLLSCLAVAALSIVLLGALLLALAFEGAVCLLMAAPIGLPLALMGGAVGYTTQQKNWNRQSAHVTFGAVLLFLPLIMGTEALNPQLAPLLDVKTSIEIDAPPEVVWRYLKAFPTLPTPDEWPFRVGIAYPIRATLQGYGVGAQRECQFSTGQFVEPIQVWEENRRLAFTITNSPLVMEELSPYGHIHTRHIDEQYFQAQDAEFLLTRLPGDRTMLTGTSHYRNRMWPIAYWSLWSDAIVHEIHLRVFRQIKRLAEDERLQTFVQTPVSQ